MKRYEVECSRSNVTPKQFFAYCKKQMEKHGANLEDWCENLKSWAGEDGVPSYNNSYEHKDWDIPTFEICKTLPYDWQLFLGGKYNFILEFQFDSDNKGYGYMYCFENE